MMRYFIVQFPRLKYFCLSYLQGGCLKKKEEEPYPMKKVIIFSIFHSFLASMCFTFVFCFCFSWGWDPAGRRYPVFCPQPRCVFFAFLSFFTINIRKLHLSLKTFLESIYVSVLSERNNRWICSFVNISIKCVVIH